MTEIQKAEQELKDAERICREARQNLEKILECQNFPRGASPYWYLRNDGNKWEVCSGIFGPGSALCQRRRAAGNCYRTQEEAEVVADIRNTLTAKIEGWI